MSSDLKRMTQQLKGVWARAITHREDPLSILDVTIINEVVETLELIEKCFDLTREDPNDETV